MGHIFLSYAREDRRTAEKLARVLEQAGHEVWWDRHIDSGEEFATEIEAELERADVVLVAWSASSIKSRWVRDEAAIGGDTGRLVSIALDGTLPPMGFRQFHSMDLTGWKGGKRDGRTAELLHSVEARLKGKAGTAQAPVPAQAPATKRRILGGWRLWATAAALVLIVATTAGLLVVRSERAQAEPASLAVLPFKNMAAGSPYFAEGVAEEIADRLSREPQFKVAGRTSSDLFKNAADVQDVGRRLHVAYVLEGSVRSAGNQVRVDVALVDTRRGMRLWNQDFSGSLDDIFGIQDSIGQQVAAHLKKELIRQAPLAGTATTRGDVYSLYVTARALTKSREPAKLAAATDLLRQAVQLDPNYAPAWAQLALTIDLGKAYGHPDEPPSARSHQEELGYAQRAISLAPGLGEAHAIYGLILGSDTLDADALRKHRQELETAVKLDPNDAYAWYWLSGDRRDALDFEGAESALRHTATIDPFFLLSASYADTAWDLGDRADALRFLKDRIANHPDPYGRYWGRLQLAGLQNNLPAAYQLAKAQDAIASPDQKPLIHGEMASILLQLGLFDQAAGLVPKDYIDLRRSWKLGRYDPVTSQSARDFWLNPDLDNPQLIPRLWVKEGHSSYLVSIYDHAFSSPEDMVSRFSHYIFMDYAPLLAIGLQQAGRHAEGMRMLTIADSMCAQKIAHGRMPISFRVGCSRVAALMGRKDEAVHALEQAFHQGWRPGEEQLSRQADEPANVLIRDDPRLKRIDAEIVRELAAQRRQLLAAGL